MVNAFHSRFKVSLVLMHIGAFAVACFPVFAAWLILSEQTTKENLQDEVLKHELILILYPLLFIFIMVCILHFVLRSPKIRISTEGLSIGSTRLQFSEITEITESERVKVNYFMIPYSKDVSVIRTSQREWFIPYDYYTNGHLIRANLVQVKKFIEGEVPNLSIIDKTKLDTKYDLPRTTKLTLYRRSVFHYFYTYLFASAIGFIFYQGLENGFDIVFFISWGLFLVFIYWICGIYAHYFLLSEQNLIVKNLLFPWQYHSFKIQDILYLEIEDSSRGGIVLKLTAQDYKVRRFGCELLNRKMLEELIPKIKESQIHSFKNSSKVML